MKDYKSLTALQKATMREQIKKKAAGMTPAKRKTYIDSLKAKGITPSTIGVGTTKKSTLKESYLGKKKVPAKKKK